MCGKAFGVHLVDDQLLEGQCPGCIALPIEGGVVDDDRFRHDRSRIAGIQRLLAGSGLRVVREQKVVGIAELSGDRFGVRVENDLGAVESQPGRRVVLSGHPVTVELARRHAVDVDVPHTVCRPRQRDDIGGLLSCRGIEQQEDLAGVLRVDGEIDAGRRRSGTQRRIRTRGRCSVAAGTNLIHHLRLLAEVVRCSSRPLLPQRPRVGSQASGEFNRRRRGTISQPTEAATRDRECEHRPSEFGLDDESRRIV